MHQFEHHWHPMDYGNGVVAGFGGWPGMLLSTLSTLFWVVLFTWLAWVLLGWVLPYLFPQFAGDPGEISAEPAALETLCQRYAAGEIDGVTFEQMRERLIASYQAESDEFQRDDGSYIPKTWI